MTHRHSLTMILIAITLASSRAALADENARQGEQLPSVMHTKMSERPRITVGHANADLIGTDHRALQAAVDYIAALGSGLVGTLRAQSRASDSR